MSTVLRNFVPLLIALLLSLMAVGSATADHTPEPAAVTIAGDLQTELGCPDDWQPDCADTHLTYDAGDDVWQATFALPAGDWAYKAALDDAWDENYGANATPDGPNLGLALADAATVKFYYDHNHHWVTDNVNSLIATVAGDFQSELGCPGDWQPDCLRSWLQDPDGDGVYHFTSAALPAGDYAAKVAHDEAWDENYGAGGVLDGPDIVFSVDANQSVTFEYHTDSHLLTITVESGGLEAGDEELVRPRLQHPFQDQVLYFTIPDRFNDGDPTNNCGDYVGPCQADDSQENVLQHGYLPSDKGYYHGGDLQGLRQKLDYLEGMGVTTIWVGPIYKNKSVQVDTSNLYGHSSGYHGYWILDFLQVDPHLGTNQAFKELVDDAHARGIQVFMDIVTNHTADVIQLEGNAGYRSKAEYPYRDVDGEAFDDALFAYSGQPDYTFPNVTAESFPYTPQVPAAEADAKQPAWLNDPLLYHNRGDSTFAGESSLYGDFFGLDDLWTERKEVVEGMIDIYSFWIETFGVDGFRIDTTKHVNLAFWQKFGPDILAAARARGIDHFFAFGEVFDQRFGAPFLSEFSTDGKLQSTIDFSFQLAARDFAAQSGATNHLKEFFASDDYYTDADSNAYIQPTFLGNHDMGRIGFFLQREDQPEADDAELLARSKLAHGLMYFARGQPVIYYGDEQGFTGDGGDKDAREDMFANFVAVYDDNDLIGSDATTSQDNFDPAHPLYQALTGYAQVYQSNLALRRGAQIHRLSSDGPGVYAFSRIERDEQIEYVIALNNAESPRQAMVPTFYAGDVQFDRVYAEGGNAPESLTTTANGALALSVPGLGFVIYRAERPIPTSQAAPAIRISNLQNGQAVDLSVESEDGHRVVQRLEVAADLTPAGFAEVTFAVKVDDGDYEPIGTDDNPPYRVFYDVTDLPPGTTLSFKAIVDDLSGHLNAAKVTGIVPNVQAAEPASAAVPYAVVHYSRPAGDYGDPTMGDFNDYWGLHLWGDAIDPGEATDWTSPKPFLGEDAFGRFAWIRLANTEAAVNFIVHQGDIKDGTEADRSFDPAQSPEIWINAGEAGYHTTQADAQGFVTIHYQRLDGVYDNGGDDYWGLHLWGDAIDPAEATDWAAPKRPDGVDDYGAFWTVQLDSADPQASSQPLNFIVHKPSGDNSDVGGDREPGGDRQFIPAETAAIWLLEQDVAVYAQRGAAENFATIHYHRADGDYGDPTSTDFNDFWGLHVWTGAATATDWQNPLRWQTLDPFGPVYRVDLAEGATQLAYIIHRGDDKDPGPDQLLNLGQWGYEVWQVTGEGPDPAQPNYVLPVAAAAVPAGDLGKAQAHWVTADTIAWEIDGGAANDYTLHYDAEGGLALENGTLSGGTTLSLSYDPNGLSAEVLAKFPHLAGFAALKIDPDNLEQVPDILKGQFAVSATREGTLVDATSLQIPGVLDDLYTFDGALGVVFDGDVPSLHLWAPTARSVTLHRFDDADPAATSTPQAMTLDPASGVWSIQGEAAWTGQYYLYEVEIFVPASGQVMHNLVTDPYSLSLSANSARSQIVDLDDPALAPSGWESLVKPALAAPEDIAIYELHLRDFSMNDESVPEALRGTYRAFTQTDSHGMQHLAALADAGLTHVHLLPVFDIATIEERRGLQETPAGDLAGFPPDSTQQQAAVAAVADQDGYNWGYDPWHYTTPEGSYATDPDGTARIVEFRQMVQALNQIGLRVVMDVVYNHTNASGQAEKSVLDRIVPGYYHRLDGDGNVATSTCCQNTASEHNMMEKLMVDSVRTWATQYKVDGFRFDLMGHHSKQNILNVRAALDALTSAEDGVDGSQIYLYGEGWNFGEVADNARFQQATQANMAGTGIGTFNDRLRDAVRGGGPFDGGEALIRNQGFINGLFYDPNQRAQDQLPEADRQAELLLSADQIRVGLAGNLADYEFVDRNGDRVSGADVDYNGAPAGYGADPQEQIVYVSAHDNQTLFDISQYKHPLATTMADRVRAQNLGIDLTVLAQGVPFFHAGVDTLRSKSLDRDSFNSGDWFNKLDFTYGANNWGVGLPVESVNGDNWPLMQPLLADPALQPTADDIEAAVAHMQEMLAVRKSSRLFRLAGAADVQARLAFYNTGPDQLPGLIVMALSDHVQPDLDPFYESFVVLFNANDAAQTFSVAALAGVELALHPVQAASADVLVQDATFDSAAGTFTVPGRTTAVFVELETPSVQIERLVDAVEALAADGALNQGQANSLISQLAAAQAKLDEGPVMAVCNQLDAFVNHVQGLVNGGVLTPEAGQPLLEAAQHLVRQLCG